ncbi:hypothetical protein LC048_19670 [Mesobacillus subterraneus]|uniref:hypothetical protein n=1 Tax=Mesobacillus subterraneus TaxID=285983 RepID=UPI00273DBEE9|nr:hypothetical protein [Mesobacillus subterraneus]WLR54615.1 hypothetical protein LC048_19670 [Mesobacillus subterraneus]
MARVVNSFGRNHRSVAFGDIQYRPMRIFNTFIMNGHQHVFDISNGIFDFINRLD